MVVIGLFIVLELINDKSLEDSMSTMIFTPPPFQNLTQYILVVVVVFVVLMRVIPEEWCIKW